ncbi:MAG: DUF2341 domain-containing protein [Candidatus Nanohalobium sp.]
MNSINTVFSFKQLLLVTFLISVLLVPANAKVSTETADSETINEGTLLSGNVSDTRDDDGTTKDIEEVLSGGILTLDTEEFYDTDVSRSDILKLNITVNAWADGETMNVRVFNLSSSSYVSTGIGVSATSDGTTYFATLCESGCDVNGKISNFVGSGGGMQTQFLDNQNEGNFGTADVLRIDYQSIKVIYDSDAPEWRNQRQNNSRPDKGGTLKLAAQGIDEKSLDGAILATNESGSWDNKSGVYGSPKNPDTSGSWTWTNFTWSNSSVPTATTVGWRIWYNDSASNYNGTKIKEFIVNPPPNTKKRTFNGTDYGQLKPQSDFLRTDEITFRANVTDEELDEVWISVKNESGGVKVENASMTNISAVDTGGKYEYNYSIPDSGEIGEWSYAVWSNDSSGLTAYSPGNFDVFVDSFLNITYWNTTTWETDLYSTRKLTANVTCDGGSPDAECGNVSATLRYADYDGEPKDVVLVSKSAKPFYTDNTDWWNTSWRARKKVKIAEQSGRDLRNHQVLVNVSYESEMQQDFGDLRFVNATDQTAPYWIENNVTGKYAEVWVKLSNLSAGSEKTLELYYGNSDAEDGENRSRTMTFFDDFEGYSTNDPANTDVWNVTADVESGKTANPGNANFTKGELWISIDGDGSNIFVETARQFPMGVMETKRWITNGDNERSKAGQGNMTQASDNDPTFRDPYQVYTTYTYDPKSDYSANFKNGTQKETQTSSPQFDTFFSELWRSESYTLGDRCQYKQAGELISDFSDPACPGDGKRELAFSSKSFGPTLQPHQRIEWIQLRKYVETKPTVDFTQETSIKSCPQNNLEFGERCSIEWTVNASQKGGFNLDANFSSSESWVPENDSANRQINVDLGYLSVGLFAPVQDPLEVPKFDTFWLNASVDCKGEPDDICGDVDGGARYNVSQVFPDLISTDTGAKPFFVTGGDSNPKSCGSLSSGQSCLLNWSVNATGYTPSYWLLDSNFTSSESAIKNANTSDTGVCISSCPTYLDVSISDPAQNTLVSRFASIYLNASVECSGEGNCGRVEGVGRFNLTGSNPDTAIEGQEGLQLLKPTDYFDDEEVTSSEEKAFDFPHDFNGNTSAVVNNPSTDPSVTWRTWENFSQKKYKELNLTVTFSTSGYSDDDWFIYYDNSSDSTCDSSDNTLVRSVDIGRNVQKRNYSVSLPDNENLSELELCVSGQVLDSEDGGDVNIYDIRTNGTVNSSAFSTINKSNPLVCDRYLENGEKCNVTWNLNATGKVGGFWSLDVGFHSNRSSIVDNDTTDRGASITDQSFLISLKWDELEFGVLGPGTENNSALGNENLTYNITVLEGSFEVGGLWVRGTDLNYTGSDNYSIPVENISYSNQSDIATEKELQKQYNRLETDIPPGTNVTSFYWIDVPQGRLRGIYNGTIYYKANATG